MPRNISEVEITKCTELSDLSSFQDIEFVFCGYLGDRVAYSSALLSKKKL
jgi:hypothetical protein